MDVRPLFQQNQNSCNSSNRRTITCWLAIEQSTEGRLCTPNEVDRKPLTDTVGGQAHPRTWNEWLYHPTTNNKIDGGNNG